MSNPVICAECANLQKTCCSGSQVFLTVGDVRRIETDCSDFYIWEKADAIDPVTLAQLDPLWLLTFSQPEGRRVLARRADGACVFLDHAGCRLPVENRPLVCRLYPFEYNHETIKSINPHRCPEAMRQNGPLLLAMLGMHRDQAELLRAQLYKEIREEFPRLG